VTTPQEDRRDDSSESWAMGGGLCDEVCVRCFDLIPEFAVGVLSGRERAEMLVHLQGCGHCQHRVNEFAVMAQRVVGLVPEAEPTAGFEHRVLDAIMGTSAEALRVTSAAPEAGLHAPSGRAADGSQVVGNPVRVIASANRFLSSGSASRPASRCHRWASAATAWCRRGTGLSWGAFDHRRGSGARSH